MSSKITISYKNFFVINLSREKTGLGCTAKTKPVQGLSAKVSDFSFFLKTTNHKALTFWLVVGGDKQIEPFPS